MDYTTAELEQFLAGKTRKQMFNKNRWGIYLFSMCLNPICPYCNRIFQSQEELQTHVISIILGTEYQSTFCILMQLETQLQGLIQSWDI